MLDGIHLWEETRPFYQNGKQKITSSIAKILA